MPETLTDAQKVLRNDTGKRMAAALEALASEVDPSTVIAPEYDPTLTYAVGDLVIYRSVLYRCTTAITTPEEWTAAHWTAVTVADELADKYVKPTGGIPKNDMAAGVQESLNKADTALQQHQSLAAYRTAAAQDVIDANLMALGLSGAAVGDLVRVAGVDANGKPTSWRKAPLCEIKTNPNLVDNGYFFNAVNRRGQGSYPNPGYCIDRWSKGTGGSINSIGPTYGLLVTQGTAIIQAFESGLKSSLENKVCTLSIAITSGTFLTVYYGTFAYQSSPSAPISVFNNSNMKGEIGTDGKLYVTWQASSNYGLAAVKLELGSEQTIAHQENGVWVLNEIPDYETELIKCKTSTADPTDTYSNEAIAYNTDLSTKANIIHSEWGRTLNVSGVQSCVLIIGLSLFTLMITGTTPTINLARMGDYTAGQFGTSVTAQYSTSGATATITATGFNSFSVSLSADNFMTVIY